MNIFNLGSLIENIRSLGFGGLFGSGTLGLFRVLFPELFPAEITLEDLLIIGALFGAGGHRLINTMVVNSIFRPLGKFLSYYSKLVQLLMLRNLIGRKRQKEYLIELSRRYFLDESSTSDEKDIKTKSKLLN